MLTSRGIYTLKLRITNAVTILTNGNSIKALRMKGQESKLSKLINESHRGSQHPITMITALALVMMFSYSMEYEMARAASMAVLTTATHWGNVEDTKHNFAIYFSCYI